MRAPEERLKDILEAITNIERYTVRGQEAFEQDELIQTWVLYHFQLIGEAAARLGRIFHEAHPEIPWSRIVAMRNLLIHEYFAIDRQEVWKTVENDLPNLKQQIAMLLKALGGDALE